MSKLRTRFAPTPNGHLHLGNFYNLIWVSLIAGQRSAPVGLRIDDYDRVRYRSAFVDAIFRVLDLAKFEWSFGPTGTADFEANHSSKFRLDAYRAAEAELKKSDRTYWCTCTRKLERGAKLYSGRCREARHQAGDRNDEGLAAQLRFRVSESLQNAIGDLIVVPRAGEVSYQVASVVDDSLMGYNLLVRGQDLEPSSRAQLELAPAMGLGDFTRAEFFHHRTITGPDGEKLSKSQHASPVEVRLKAPGGLREILRDFARSELGIAEAKDCPDSLAEFTAYALAQAKI